MKRGILISVIALILLLINSHPAISKLSSKDWKKAKKTLELLISSDESPEERIIEAVYNVAEDNSERAINLLMKVGLKIHYSNVYNAIKKALSTITDPKAIKLIHKQHPRALFSCGS